MLVDCSAHETCFAGCLVKVGEKLCLLIVVVLMDAVVPGYAVACEV